MENLDYFTWWNTIKLLAKSQHLHITDDNDEEDLGEYYSYGISPEESLEFYMHFCVHGRFPWEAEILDEDTDLETQESNEVRETEDDQIYIKTTREATPI